MNFQLAKENMIKQQILPEGIGLGRLIDAIIEIPRENFMPKGYETLAYADTKLVFDGCRDIKSPIVLSKILHNLDIEQNNEILCLGLEDGYSLAIIAKLANKVSLLDYPESILNETKEKLLNIGIKNIEMNLANELNLFIENKKTFDRIYISEAITIKEINESILPLLSNKGKIIFIQEYNSFQKVCLITKKSENNFEKKELFDIYTK